MIKNAFTLLCILISSMYSLYAREVVSFTNNWKFILEDIRGAEKTDFDASSWQHLSIPHDWAFEKGVTRKGTQMANGGYFDGGVGWYRYEFSVSSNFENKLHTIEFDGVYMNSEVWINGTYLGNRPYGYISFRYEISKYLKPGRNVLAVKVDNSIDTSARWYHPCGIYAPVRMISTNKTYIIPNGIFVTTEQVASSKAILNIETIAKSCEYKKRNLVLEISVSDASGKKVAFKKQPLRFTDTSSVKSRIQMEVSNPILWNTENPYLYKVFCKIVDKSKVIDESEAAIGVRIIKWDTETGFWLNGKQTKLLGVCEHYEGGPVGGAWTEPLLRWKLSLLKEMGVNAIRTAHNPCPPFFYDMCDEMGFLVMDEIFDGWGQKAFEDYGKQAFNQWWQKDVTEWITRNRNHPSIVIYSVGNETRGEVGKDLVALCNSIDHTRPVTSGHSASDFMNVYGVNGGSERMDFYTKPRPDKPFVATEAPHTWQTRGYYRTKTWLRDGNEKKVSAFPLPDLTEKEIFYYEWAPKSEWNNYKQHFNSSYDNATVRISARKNWEIMRDSSWFSGHFRWTGFDYYGEAEYVHGGWPFRLFMGGALDVAGFKKDLFYFYQSQWTKNPMIHILPHWTHPLMVVGTKVPVWVYSNCEEVELFINGKSLGKDKPGTKWDNMQCEWQVPYEKGTLTAIGYINGRKVVEESQITAGTPATLKLSLDNNYVSPAKDKTAIVTVSVNDAQGVFYPYGENTIFYHIDGPAKIVSLENGSPVDTSKNFGVKERMAFMGLSNAFIKLDNYEEPVSLTVGAILGEKQLLTSRKIAIDVKSLPLRGAETKANFKIYYTTDGSVPTPQATEYFSPFDVTPGTTVKAIVVHNSQTVLTMQETFDKGLGLSWVNDSENSFTKRIGIKAVNAKYVGAQQETVNNQSCVKLTDKNGFVRWYQENDGNAGKFNLKVYMENQNEKQDNTLELYVNGAKINSFKINSGELNKDNWQVIRIECDLKAGANEIELRSTGRCDLGIYMLDVYLDH